MAPSPDQQRLEMIAEVARLYHEENYNLAKIGRKFGISTSTVSRLLKEAHDLKIVEVVIRYPSIINPALSEELKSKFHLKAAYVLPEPREADAHTIERVGRLAARVLEECLRDRMSLAISLGRAVSETAKAFRVTKTMHCAVLRLQGADQDEIAEGTALAQLFSLQLGNEYRVIPSPWIMSSREACESILQEPAVQSVIREAEAADIAMVGVGAMDPNVSTIFRNKLISSSELQALRKSGAVGEISGKYFDQQGNVLDTEFNKRSVSIDINKLRKIPTVMGVAAGVPKAEAIAGALRGRLLNVLVTDSVTARKLLENGTNHSTVQAR